MTMNNDTLYWIWLQQALGISSALRTQDILAAFHDTIDISAAERIYKAPDYERRVSGVFTGQQLDRLARTSLSMAEAIAGECERNETHILTPRSADYPARLLEIMNHPLVLYVRGSLACMREQLGIAVVGTRHADRKSVDIAGRLSASLARAGCVIVSGGALGIDSAAHRGAIAAGGKTVAVLGCGLRFNYLMENNALRAQIAGAGALVSEFPGDTPALAHNFPIRNRIISGMTVGTVVVEAGEKSGSLITADCAADQGRDVFAVPGDAFGSTYMGANKLIREGAKPVFSAMDVLEEYELVYPELLNMRKAERNLDSSVVLPYDAPVPKKPRMRKNVGAAPLGGPAQATTPAATAPQAISPAAGGLQGAAAPTTRDPLETKLLTLLRDDMLHVDAICAKTGEKLGTVFTALTNLEIEGLVRQGPGRMYEAAGDE